MTDYFAGDSVNVQRATRVALVLLAAGVVALAAMVVRENKLDTVAARRRAIELRLDALVVDPPTTTAKLDTRNAGELAKQVSDNTRLWGPLIKPPPPPPPPEVNLAELAQGLSVIALLGDIKSGSTIRFLINDGGKKGIVGKGDKLRDFVIKDYTENELILEYKGRTHPLPLPGK